MKAKIIILACSFLCATTFTSCDLNFLETILGNSTLTVSESSAPTFYADSTDVHFSSCINDWADLDSISSYMMIAAKIDLQSSDIIETPYMATAFNDTVPQSYTIECPLVLDSFVNFNVSKLLNAIEGHNLFVLAASDTCWYVGYNGTITFDQYPAVGLSMNCDFNNVQAYYITQSDIDYLEELIEAVKDGDITATETFRTLTVDNLFEHVTFNGAAMSRRCPVGSIIESIQ